MGGEILAIVHCLNNKIPGGPVMRVSWMALLCAVFVSLFPLPVDASEEVCVTCHITLDLPAIVPSLTCVHSSFELLESAEICYCAVKVTISNECSKELTVYKQASSTAIQCTENNSDECETLPAGGYQRLPHSVQNSSHPSDAIFDSVRQWGH